METDTTQQTAETALQQQSATTTDTTTTPIEAAPSTNQRPDFIPESFWDAQKGEAKLDQLAISYANLEKAFSSKSQAPKKPGADASPEDQAKYFADLRKFTGAPEKPEDYGLKAPDKLPEGVEWNAELAGKAASIAHKYSVPPEALQELINLNNENISGLVEKSQAMQQEQVDAMVAELNAEWKDNAMKPCCWCKETMTPSPSSRPKTWEKKKYCSSACSAAAIVPTRKKPAARRAS